MGRDKALLEFRGLSLLQHAINLAKTISQDVRIVGDPAKYGAYGPAIADVYLERGPLGGIHAALAGSSADINLILATDLPLVEPGFLRYLVATAQAHETLVTVPQIGTYFEPLCAVYRKRFVEIAEAALLAGKNKVDALFAPEKTRVVSEEEIVAAGFSWKIFRNVNTPDDWEQIKQ